MVSRMYACQVLALLILASIVSSQAPFSSPETIVPVDQLLCNTSIDQANASGVYPFAIGYPKDDGSTLPDPSWAITVTLRGGEKTKTSIWYDTAGERYDQDLEINYDVCAFIVLDLPRNTYLLGQRDPDDCSSMLTSTCASAISSRATSSALQWTSYQGPNMTDGVLPAVCEGIKRDIREEMARECKQEFNMSLGNYNQGANIFDIGKPTDHPLQKAQTHSKQKALIRALIALTGNNFTNLDKTPCDLTASPDKHFRQITTQIQNSSFPAFWNATQSIYPILTVFMPVANAVASKSDFASQANSSLRCVRARDPHTSIDVPALPPGEPWAAEDENHSGLSAAAKGGIAAGAVVVTLLLAGCVAWLYRRKPRSRRSEKSQQSTSVSANAAEQDHAAEALLKNEQKVFFEADVGSCVEGKPSRDYKVQLDGIPMAELDGNRRSAELGHVRDVAAGGE